MAELSSGIIFMLKKKSWLKASLVTVLMFVCMTAGSALYASDEWDTVISTDDFYGDTYNDSYDDSYNDTYDNPYESAPHESTDDTDTRFRVLDEDEPLPSETSSNGAWDDFVSNVTKPTLKINPASPEKPLAFIFAGNLSSIIADLADSWDSLWEGREPPPENAAAVKWIGGIVSKAKEALEKAGYSESSMQTNLRAVHSDLRKALENPQTGAIIWIGHGKAGKIIDASGNNETGRIDGFIVRRWAVEFLKKKGIYKDPAEYRDDSVLKKVMARIGNEAHFGVDYFYSHSCKTMEDPLLAMTIVTGGGRYEGYDSIKLAYVSFLSPSVSDTAKQKIPDVHSIMVVPEVTGQSKKNAKEYLEERGFSVTIIEGAEDEFAGGHVYSQTPFAGTILDKNKSDKKVELFVYKEQQDNTGPRDTGDTDDSGDTGDAGDSGDDDKYMVWINKFGNSGRIHAGPVIMFKHRKKYKDEWLAGKSQEYLEKDDISGGKRYDNINDAKEAACSMTSNRRNRRVPGWGSVPMGDMGGKSYYIDGLGCSIP